MAWSTGQKVLAAAVIGVAAAGGGIGVAAASGGSPRPQPVQVVSPAGAVDTTPTTVPDTTTITVAPTTVAPATTVPVTTTVAPVPTTTVVATASTTVVPVTAPPSTAPLVTTTAPVAPTTLVPTPTVPQVTYSITGQCSGTARSFACSISVVASDGHNPVGYVSVFPQNGNCSALGTLANGTADPSGSCESGTLAASAQVIYSTPNEQQVAAGTVPVL